MPSAQLDQESDPCPSLSIERQVDEGRDAHQVETGGREVTARDSDRLDGLVDSTGPDRTTLDAALTPDDSGDGPSYRDRLRGSSSLKHFYGRSALVRHWWQIPSSIVAPLSAEPGATGSAGAGGYSCRNSSGAMVALNLPFSGSRLRVGFWKAAPDEGDEPGY